MNRERVTSISDERFAHEMAMARHIWQLRRRVYRDAVLNHTTSMRVVNGVVEHAPSVALQRCEAATANVNGLWVHALMRLAQDDEDAVWDAYCLCKEICQSVWPP